MELSFLELGAHFGSQAGLPAAYYTVPTPLPALELPLLVRTNAQEEVTNLRRDAPQASVAALAEVVQEEMRRVVQQLPLPQPEPHVMSYSEALWGCPPPQGALSPIIAAPAEQYPLRSRIILARVWRTPNKQPLSYHCGGPGHILAAALTA